MDQSLRLDQQDRWRRGERVLVESYLGQFPDLARDAAALAELIGEEVTLRSAAGETPRLDEYLGRFPQCSAELARIFGNGVHEQATVAAPPESSAPGSTLPPNTPSYETINTDLPRSATAGDQGSVPLETIASDATGELATAAQILHAGWPEIPGFKILGELGRGGMGVVYKARQQGADRLVALKVVRRDVLEALPLDSQSSTLGRFKHEAQAAARLQHDNLVTVYEVGEVNGQWYYAMRYVQGKSLHDMLRAGPLANRRAAAYLEPVARALAAAHEQGILHRDLKPHNIMVDERSDRPLLADFGLAKFVDASDELTRAGDVMGTPSYMSPEQARDSGRVTPLADVYSLGATLYHLLTSRPPFQAASLAETLRQIASDEPVAPRTLNPAIDRDLETICLKCLQKEPSRRYASAGALADDLKRYLEGLPILARPIGPAGRLWRWCRRNPWLAGLSATAASLALVALIAIIVGYVNTAAALATSESRLQRALAVVDELFTRLSEDELLNEPGMQPLRKDLLARALKHYQYFLAESGGNPAIRDEVAAARFRIGLITQYTGARKEALAEFDAARALQQQLLAEAPENVARIKALADTWNALGSLHKEAGEMDEAAKCYTEAAAFRQHLTLLDRESREYVRLLANTRMNLAVIDLERGELDRARNALSQAQAARQALLATKPEPPKVRRDLAMGYFNLANVARTAAKPADEARHLQAAIEQFELLLARDGRSLANRYYLAACYRMLAALEADAGKLMEALAMYAAAQRQMQTLAVGNPDVPLYQSDLALLAMNRGDLYLELSDLPAAKTAWIEALAATGELLKREPANPDYRRDLASSEGALGHIALQTGDRDEAVKWLTAARGHLQELVSEFPTDPTLARQLAETTEDLMRATAEKSGS